MTPHPHVSPRSSSRHIQVRPRQHLLPPGEVRLRRAPPAQGVSDQPVLVAAVLLPRHGAPRQLEADAGARPTGAARRTRAAFVLTFLFPFLPQALDYLSGAISIDARNPLARFKKAEVLISQGEYTDALSELTTLIEVAPKEGSVYFTLGKARASPFAPARLPARPPARPPCARAPAGRAADNGRCVAMASADHGVVSGLCPTTPSRRLAERCPRGEGGPPHSDARPASRFPATPPWGERSMSLGTPPAQLRTHRRRPCRRRRQHRRHRRSSVHACRHHLLRRRRSQVYKKLGDSSKAMVNFTRALDLSPKDAQQIKTAILNLEKEDAAGDDDEY